MLRLTEGNREKYLCSAEVEGVDVFSQNGSECLQNLHVSHARSLGRDELIDQLAKTKRQVLNVEGREALAEGGFYGAEAQGTQVCHLRFAILPAAALDMERRVQLWMFPGRNSRIAVEHNRKLVGDTLIVERAGPSENS